MNKDIRLIPLSEEYLELALEWRNAESVRKNMYTSHVISLEEHKRWFEGIKDDATKRYFIVSIEGELLGVVGFTEINNVMGIASWAFYASPKAPRGTGSKMEFSALDYAFNELKLHKLRCEVLGFNQPVVKLHTKFGFTLEGTHRDAHYDGESYQDVIHLGLLEQEWQLHREVIKDKLGL